ncbi:hypothetical protein PIB30_063238 [Stylosanthes scabra]|uniref:Uncharacterized protein n=1 Tax=Stylosanthes scabra TaxID=79078 RepID=A0ABU6VMD2_9FABA|nr:hypothetical protein [Stylosanthes scabra]
MATTEQQKSKAVTAKEEEKEQPQQQLGRQFSPARRVPAGNYPSRGGFGESFYPAGGKYVGNPSHSHSHTLEAAQSTHRVFFPHPFLTHKSALPFSLIPLRSSLRSSLATSTLSLAPAPPSSLPPSIILPHKLTASPFPSPFLFSPSFASNRHRASASIFVEQQRPRVKQQQRRCLFATNPPLLLQFVGNRNPSSTCLCLQPLLHYFFSSISTFESNPQASTDILVLDGDGPPLPVTGMGRGRVGAGGQIWGRRAGARVMSRPMGKGRIEGGDRRGDGGGGEGGGEEEE